MESIQKELRMSLREPKCTLLSPCGFTGTTLEMGLSMKPCGLDLSALLKSTFQMLVAVFACQSGFKPQPI